MQREILNVAKACQLPGFRYVRFPPVKILPRPSVAAEPAPEEACEPEPVPVLAGAVERERPLDALEPAAPMVAAVVAASEPESEPEPEPEPEHVAAPVVPALERARPRIAAVETSSADLPTVAEGPAVRQNFALLVELDQSIAARTPQRPTGRFQREPRAEPPAAALPPINRTIGKTWARVAVSANGTDRAELPEAAPALLAEIDLSLRQRAKPQAEAAPAHRPRPSRTP